MPALPSSTRYANYDTSVVLFVPTIADPSAPTRIELDAGTDLTGEISDASGWTVEGADIDTPDLKSEFVSKVPGRTSSPDSSLTFYASENGTDVRDVLTYKQAGYIVVMNGGDVAGQPMDVFPVRVKSGLVPTLSVGDETAKIAVGFSITREPSLSVPVPA